MGSTLQAAIIIDELAQNEAWNGAPSTGIKTVTATPAAIFASASVKANRRRLVIKNEDLVLRIRVGSATITQQTGFPIEPGGAVDIKFDPATAVDVYACSEGAALQISVLEV